MHKHCSGCFEWILWSLSPIFVGGADQYHYKNFISHVNLGDWVRKNRYDTYFWRPGNVIPNSYGVVPGRWKSAWHRFSQCPTPQSGCASIYTIETWFGPEIWGPNSPLNEFVCHTWHDVYPWLSTHNEIGVLSTTVLVDKYVLLGVQCPYFGCIRVRGPSSSVHTIPVG